MAERQNTTKNKSELTSTQPLSWTKKVLLNGLLGTSEASFAFEQLYTASVLQRLGLSVSFVSMPLLVSGSMSALLITLLGWLSDRGSNQRHRKMATVIFSSAILLAGTASVMVANVLHFSGQCSDLDGCFPNISAMTRPVPVSTDPYYHLRNVSSNPLKSTRTIHPSRRNSNPSTKYYEPPVSESIEASTRLNSSIISLQIVNKILRNNEHSSNAKPRGTRNIETPTSTKASILHYNLPKTGTEPLDNRDHFTTGSNKASTNVTPLASSEHSKDLQPSTVRNPHPFTDTENSALEHPEPRDTEPNTTQPNTNSKPPAKTNSPTNADYQTNAELPAESSPDDSIPEPNCGDQATLCALLAIMGFMCLDIGFDTTSTFSRSWALASTPFPQHASILKTGVVVSSVGAAVPAAVGLLDLDTLLGLRGTVMRIDFIQATIILTIVVTATVVVVVIGNRLFERYKDDISIELSKSNNQKASSDQDSIYNESEKHEEIIFDLSENERSSESLDSFNGFVVASETIPILNGTPKNEVFPLNSKHSIKALYGSAGNKVVANGKPHNMLVKEKESSTMCNLCLEKLYDLLNVFPTRGFKWRVSAIFMGTYFSTGAIILFDYLAADYAGKVIFGGHPSAVEGSVEAENYQKGIRVAAWALIMYSVTFLLYSLVQYRVLDFVGYRTEFVVSQLLVGVFFAILAVTARVEVLFVLAGAAGMRRASQCVAPFKMVNDAIHKQTEKGRVKVGTAMAVVGSSFPIGACTLYPWVGWLEDSTGIAAMPMWLGSIYAVLSALCFLTLPKE